MSGGFTQEVGDFIRKANLRTDTAIRKVAADLLRGVVEKSPVDTGRFRANWVVSTAPTDQTILGLDRSGIDAINRGLQLIQLINPKEDEIWISNNLPYARRLEYGWSKQAPRGMVRLTVLEYRRAVERAVRSLGR